MMTARMVFSWIIVALLANLHVSVADAEQEPNVELEVGDSVPAFTSVDDQGTVNRSPSHSCVEWAGHVANNEGD